MKEIKNITKGILVLCLIASSISIVGCKRKEDIPSMIMEPSRWEITISPGWMKSIYNEKESPYIYPEEVQYPHEPIRLDDEQAFDTIMLVYPRFNKDYKLRPEIKAYYYNTKGEKIESTYYTVYGSTWCYRGQETEFEKIKEDTENLSWALAVPFYGTGLFKGTIEFYQSKETANQYKFYVNSIDIYVMIKGENNE